MSTPNVFRDMESNPYYLKRVGEFEKALRSYIHEFKEALNNGNFYICGICFDQIFDILLLQYLKKKAQFHNQRKLRQHLQKDIAEKLKKAEVFERESFNRYFSSCWERFGSKAIGETSFSVDRQLLIDSANPSKQKEQK